MKPCFPSVALLTCVDNIEVTGPDATRVSDAMDGLQAFSDLMEVAIDTKKSYTWSIQTQQRQQLRSQKHVTKLSARDLGGHVQYSQIVTNSTVVQKCEAMPPLWNRLARSCAVYKQKVQAICAKAWPSCLHGIASVHLGED